VNAVVHSVLAASEPSKVPFYVMGAILASWAVVLSAIGLSQADFPGSPARARAVMGISAVLVLGTVTSAVATSSKHHGEGHAEAAKPHGQEPAPPSVDTTKTPPSSGKTPRGGGQATAPGTGKPPPSGGGATLEVTADPSGQLKYEQTTLTASAGKVKVTFDNPSPVDHDVTIADGQTKVGGTKAVSQGKATATVDLKPGSYTFYCSVDGHRQAGMEGKLTVS
jgi:plastocyanin